MPVFVSKQQVGDELFTNSINRKIDVIIFISSEGRRIPWLTFCWPNEENREKLPQLAKDTVQPHAISNFYKEYSTKVEIVVHNTPPALVQHQAIWKLFGIIKNES